MSTFMKILTGFLLLGSIGFLFLPGPPSLYAKLLLLTSMLISALEYWWPRIKAFLRAHSLAIRILFAGFLTFVVFIDIKTNGLTKFSFLTILFALGCWFAIPR